ncbi:hypothetical protein A2U01_0070216, partial [Trifolium medium]|nr:hypothetical protein [Trifolium medium]
MARASTFSVVGANRVTIWSMIDNCVITGTGILRGQFQDSVLIARFLHMANVCRSCDHDQHQYEQGEGRCIVAIVRGRWLGRIVGGGALVQAVIRGR